MQTQFLTRDQVAATVPSALAETHDGMRSDRYSFVRTLDIVEAMEANGWGVVKATCPKARKERSRDFGIHRLEFQSKDQTFSLGDPRSNSSNGRLFPRIHVLNSHNGTSRFTIHAGFYAIICSNGLVISYGSVGAINVRHNQGFSQFDAMQAISQFQADIPKLTDGIQNWNKLQLNEQQRTEFATKAARIRWNKPDDILPDVASILNPRRAEDTQSDLWTVFNRAQENIIQGGFSRNQRKARPVSQIREDLRINQELWALAEASFAEYSVN